MHLITPRCISRAAAELSGAVVRTPVLQLPAISNVLSARLQRKQQVETFFKCENVQLSGSFKYRGALHCLQKLSPAQLRRGVVTHSTGNHAIALCDAVKLLQQKHHIKIPITVLTAEHIDPWKLARLKSSSATIVTAVQSDALAVIEQTTRLAEISGATYIPPADHADIVVGQATCMAEFLQQLEDMGVPQLDAVIIPSGGGGLLTGTALYCLEKGVRVFGAEPLHGGPRLQESLRRGTRLSHEPTHSTIADGLRTSVGQLNWQTLRRKDCIAGVLTAQENVIIDMHELLLTSIDMPVEPSAAVGVAAAASCDNMEAISRLQNGPVLRLGFVLTGGNTSV